MIQRAMARDPRSAHEEQTRMHVRGHLAVRHRPQPPSWRKTHVTQPDDRVFSFSILGTPRVAKLNRPGMSWRMKIGLKSNLGDAQTDVFRSFRTFNFQA